MRERRVRRGPWYLVTGLFFGLVMGLVYSYLLSPVKYTDVSPNLLSNDAKTKIRSMVALAYRANNDLGRARARLDLLKDASPDETLAAQAQSALADGTLQQEARALAALAAALSSKSFTGSVTQPAAMLSLTPAPVMTVTLMTGRTPAPPTLTAMAVTPTASPAPTGTITSTPFPTSRGSPQPTPTSRPSATASRTPGAPFVLKEKQTICNPQLPPGLLQVEVVDNSGKGVAGIRITITWSGGQDNFFTGLYPQISPGYADYTMNSDTNYSVRASEGGEVVSGLTAARCPSSSGSGYLGGFKLRFSQ